MRRKNITAEMMRDYLAQALLLLLEKKSYDDISIGEIAAKAGVNRSTYYRHFTAKEDLVKFYFVKIMDDYLDNLPEEGLPTQAYLIGMFETFAQHRKQLLLLYHSGLAHHILDALNRAFTDSVPRHTFADDFRVYYHTGGIFNSFLLWFSQEMHQSPAVLAKAVLQTLPDNFTPMLLWR